MQAVGLEREGVGLTGSATGMNTWESLRIALKYSHGEGSVDMSRASAAAVAAAEEGSWSTGAAAGSKMEAAAHTREMSVRKGHCSSARATSTSMAIEPSFCSPMVACKH